jgi:hypothetical protein
MTPLQFARARAGVRTVETNAALTAGAGGAPGHGPIVSQAPAETPVAAHRVLPPITFHWAYARTIINGKPAAKRTPQFADTSYWSVAINRLG